jgi:hypothetical protein
MVFENVTVDSLFAILASQQRSRKDIAVHVSLSSDLHVKQRSRLNQDAIDSEVLRLPGTMRHRRSGRGQRLNEERVTSGAFLVPA